MTETMMVLASLAGLVVAVVIVGLIAFALFRAWVNATWGAGH